MRSPELTDRRAFLKMAGTAWAAALAPGARFALAKTDAVFATAYQSRSGDFFVATVTEAGELIDSAPLPARSHGMSVCPVTGQAVAFARRPGTYAMVFSPDRSAAPIVITTPPERHFFGHGCFSRDGKLLYATENDFAANRGMIGIYDATDGFSRKGEFPTYGIGPHDMTLLNDGRMLVIANGGIETHPDFGRTKLNLSQMQPSLTLVDTDSGALIEKHAMPDHLRQLSTRHVDMDAKGRIWFACQYEGPRNDRPPLIGSFGHGDPLTFVTLPEATADAMANYCGAIAVNRRENLVAASSPKGGVSVIIDIATGTVRETQQLAQVCGLSAAPRGFITSSNEGTLGKTLSAVAWDQHIVQI